MKTKLPYVQVFLILISLYMAYFFFFPSSERGIPVRLSVAENVRVMGFNVTDEGFYFGEVGPGSIASKNITITGEKNEVAFVHLAASGNVSSWIKVSNNNLFIVGKETKYITVYAVVPNNAKLGYYEGSLKVSYKRVL